MPFCPIWFSATCPALMGCGSLQPRSGSLQPKALRQLHLWEFRTITRNQAVEYCRLGCGQSVHEECVDVQPPQRMRDLSGVVELTVHIMR